jgi:Mn-dependent DtxR family transcriptional regulator
MTYPLGQIGMRSESSPTKLSEKKEGEKMDNKFMRVEEVAEVLEVSTSFAYKVIRQLNDELKSKGYITIAGRINREYFYERVYHNGKVVI